jgi:hypothetical protein
MPDIDPERMTMALQEDAKDANESFRAYLLAENDRLRDENAMLKKVMFDNGRLSMMVDFYEKANWFYVVGTIILIFAGLLSGQVYAWFYWSLFCVGAILVGAGMITWFWGLRQNRKKLPPNS